jgi:hypothetical protein
MVEKKLRKELDTLARELEEIKEELGDRISVLKKKGMPVAAVLLGFIGLKITYRILRMILSLFWKYKFLIGAGLLLIPLRHSMMQSK